MPTPTGPELSTCAMSDIAFLLKIFFVTTSEISDERGIGGLVGQAAEIGYED